ncbi:hypothetical protein Cni_G08662 [Canna indica]|uniref:Uncharacterized protein n=1 Tax=Canna indica TaxID=4628 RepID=A0AAQ3K6M7_9LILI|nr:hypothetical protein Cni_G08662 [Canna indica]
MKGTPCSPIERNYNVRGNKGDLKLTPNRTIEAQSAIISLKMISFRIVQMLQQQNMRGCIIVKLYFQVGCSLGRVKNYCEAPWFHLFFFSLFSASSSNQVNS